MIHYPLAACSLLFFSGFVLDRPFTLDQPVYLPGNDRQGVWASPLLETVYSTADFEQAKRIPAATGGLSMSGDATLIVFVLRELRRSYATLPVRLVHEFVLNPQTLPSRGAHPGPDIGGSRRLKRSPNAPGSRN